MHKLAQAPAPIANENGVATLQGLEGVFQSVITAVLGLAAIALFLMLVVGGFKYITSGGDPKSVDAARRTLTYAIVGMVILASAFLILRFIGVFTGADVENFKVFLNRP